MEVYDAARTTDENAGSGDCKHTSGGVFVAIDNDLGAVIDREEGVVMSIPGSSGSNVQTWVKCRRKWSGFCRVLLAFGTMDAEEWGLGGSSGQPSENHQASVADGLRCQYGPRSFQEELVV